MPTKFAMDGVTSNNAQVASGVLGWGQRVTRSNKMLRAGLISAIVKACLVLGACSGLNLPELAPEGTGTVHEAPIVGSPTDIYARVARGALACWFGNAGPLKDSYVYHANAEPPAKGGTAKIVIHEREANVENPLGLRAFRISITPDGESSKVAIENLKLPDPLGASMENDVHRWARGDFGCAGASDSEQWTPKPPEKLKSSPGKKHSGHPT